MAIIDSNISRLWPLSSNISVASLIWSFLASSVEQRRSILHSSPLKVEVTLWGGSNLNPANWETKKTRRMTDLATAAAATVPKGAPRQTVINLQCLESSYRDSSAA